MLTRPLASLAALMSAGLFLAIAAGWIMAAFWNTPYRNIAGGALLGFLAICVGGCIAVALHSRKPARSAFPRSNSMRLLMKFAGVGRPER